MRLLAVAAIPIALIGAWAAWRALRGRPVRRFALNAVVGALLLGYFAITASLGIFWVANQELPVFDPHYLFGYLTLLLVVVHVTINAPLLARFVRRRSAALSADGQAFRPTVRWAGRIAGLAVFGGVCFWLGWSRGATVVTVEQGVPVQLPAAGDERRRVGMPEQLVTSEGVTVPLSRWYHDRSKLSRTAAVARGPALDWTTRPDPFETYPARAIVALPTDHEPVDRPTGAALDDARDASPAPGPADVSLRRLATLLHLTQGITSITGLPGDRFYRRAAASSGALYPTVTHVVIGNVAGVVPGLYHYEPRQHALHQLRTGDVRAELARVTAHPHAVIDTPFALVFSAIYHKSSWKYEERGYRYCLLDAGHVAANAIVVGRALGLSSRPIGRFDDAALGELLGVVPDRQGPLLVVPFGAHRDAPAPASEPGFEPDPLALANQDVPRSVLLAAGRTALRVTGQLAPPYPLAAPLPPRAAGERLELIPDGADGDPLGPVIERRRSVRRFGDQAVSAAQLATVLGRALGPSVEDQHALRLHVVALRVDGLPPGAYEYGPADGSLVLVREGDLADEIHAAALSQEVAERAAAVLVFSVDAATMGWPDGSRGYRYGWLDAGIAAGRVYQQAVALQLGVTSIGAFFDDDVAELLAMDPDADYPALLVAVGTPE